MKQKFSVSMDAEVCKRVDEMAELLNTTRSAVIATACMDYITQNDAMARLMGNPDAIQALMKSFAQPGVISAISQSMATQAEADAAQPFLEFITTYQPPKLTNKKNAHTPKPKTSKKTAKTRKK